MKKIIITILISFVLYGCTLPLNLVSNNSTRGSITSSEPVTSNTNAELIVDEELLNQLKEQIMQELSEEIQEAYQSGISDIEKMIINVGKVQGNSVLGVSNFKTDENSVLRESGTGSGVIYKKANNEYFLITNHHVIDEAEKVSVVLSDGTYIDATILGSDEMTDLAILKFTSLNTFLPVEFGDSDTIAVGQFAIAIGNPLGYQYYGSLTVGNVSGLTRDIPIDKDDDNVIDWYETLIQHDTAINPGNSGGGLFDINGKLIGINNMKIVDSDVNNIGFAIPVNTVKDIIDVLERDGKVIRASLGIEGIGVIEKIKSGDLSGIPEGVTSGIYVSKITPNSSADGSDLQPGDIIIKYNNVDIITFDDLRAVLANALVGDSVTLSVNRNSTIVTVTLTLKERPNV